MQSRSGRDSGSGIRDPGSGIRWIDLASNDSLFEPESRVAYDDGTMRCTSAYLRLGLGVCVLMHTACAKQPPQAPPGGGRLTVGVTTTGPDVDALTFRISLEPAGIGGPVQARAGVFTRTNTPVGEQVVRLTDVPARCRVEGGPERTITVSAARSTTLRLVVVCK